jgi:hypothetical protein
LEQALFELHELAKSGGTLLNKIYSIAASNPVSTSAKAFGEGLLNALGQQMKMNKEIQVGARMNTYKAVPNEMQIGARALLRLLGCRYRAEQCAALRPSDPCESVSIRG